MSGKTKILHSIQGGVGKSYIMKLFEDGINAVNDDIKYGSEGCEFGCIRMQAAGDISNMANLIFKKWLRIDKDDKGKEEHREFDPPEHVIFLIDLARACSDQLHEAGFMGKLETLLTNISTLKYEGGEVKWRNDPGIVVMSNGRPVEYRENATKTGVLRYVHGDPVSADKIGKIGYVPKCHLSAHRLIGNVFTMENRCGKLYLEQDEICDELAYARRNWEVEAQQKMVDEIKGIKTLTLQEKFEEFVMCDLTPRHPSELPMDQWITYPQLLRQLKPYAAPDKVVQTGPTCLLLKIKAWYKNHPTFKGLDVKDWCKRLNDMDREARPGTKIYKLSFEYTPKNTATVG